jgi:hypothetical protein
MNFIPALGTAVRDGAVTFKGLSQDGGWADFYKKSPRLPLFNKGFSNEPNFVRINLAGQYL